MKTTNTKGLYFSVFIFSLCMFGVYYGMKYSYELFCVSFIVGALFFAFILSYTQSEKTVEANETRRKLKI